MDDYTLEEYEIRTEAFQLQRLDREREIHKEAWLSRKVNATTDKGKYVYTDFNKFFDEKKYKQDLGLIQSNEERELFKKMKEVARKVNSRKKVN